MFEEELNVLNDTANIYEQQVEEYKQIKQARRELKLLKYLWDYVVIIETSLDEWKTTIWKKIDVEGMDQECKKFTRELRRKSVKLYYCINLILLSSIFSIASVLDKDTRSWDLYAHIESQVKNMMSSLRAVSELQNPAIRDRHWQQLMAETKVRFHFNYLHLYMERIFMAIFTAPSVVIWFSTGTVGTFATLVYVFTMRAVICDILSMAIIPTPSRLPYCFVICATSYCELPHAVW